MEKLLSEVGLGGMGVNVGAEINPTQPQMQKACVRIDSQVNMELLVGPGSG